MKKEMGHQRTHKGILKFFIKRLSLYITQTREDGRRCMRGEVENQKLQLQVEKKYFARSSAVVWGWAELLSKALIVQIVNRWDCPEILLYLCPHYVLCISLVMANEKGSSLQIHSIQPSAVCCSTQRRMRLNREEATQGKAQVEGP